MLIYFCIYHNISSRNPLCVAIDPKRFWLLNYMMRNLSFYLIILVI